MASSTARGASSGRSASSAHWSGCSANSARAQASWLRVVSVPAMSTATASETSSSVDSRSPASSMAMRSLSRSWRGRGAPRRDQVGQVGLELGVGRLDEGEVLGQVLVEDPEDVGRPRGEPPPVLLRCPQQLADDRDRVGLAQVGHHLAPPAGVEAVHESADHVAHERAEPVGRLRGEGRRHQSAQAGVVLALHGEDRLATRVLGLVGLEPVHLAQQGEGIVEPAVPQQRHAVVVPADRVAEWRPGQPVAARGPRR